VNDRSRAYGSGRLCGGRLEALPAAVEAAPGAEAVRLIDVLWIDRESSHVAAAFEVERSTSGAADALPELIPPGLGLQVGEPRRHPEPDGPVPSRSCDLLLRAELRRLLLGRRRRACPRARRKPRGGRRGSPTRDRGALRTPHGRGVHRRPSAHRRHLRVSLLRQIGRNVTPPGGKSLRRMPEKAAYLSR